MQTLDIIKNSMDFDPQTDQMQQFFALLESVANKYVKPAIQSTICPMLHCGYITHTFPQILSFVVLQVF